MVAAMLLFDTKNPQVQDSAGFLTHLGIELLLKAALMHQRARFPNEHNLGSLRAHLSDAGCVIDLSSADASAFDRISAFHKLRYHDPKGLPEIGHPYREFIHNLYLTLLKKLPERLSQAIANIDHTQKSGRRLHRKVED